MTEVGVGGNGSGSSGGATSTEAELRELRAKTDLWKQSVSVQLKEAANKNQQLRDQLQQAVASHEDDLASVRVQLDKEFRERLALKEEELASLQSQISSLREERLRVAALHESELQRLRVSSAESAAAPLREALSAREAQLVRAEHDAAVLTARLERLSAEYSELSGLLGAESSRENENVESGADRHAAQLDAARAELRGLEAKHTARLQDAARGFESERQRLASDLLARDAQLHAQAALLREAQGESAVASQRIAAMESEAHAAEDRAARRVAALTGEVARRIEAEQRATAETERTRRALHRAERTVSALESDARQREEAFEALMLTEDSRALVQRLQEDLAAARGEAEQWRARHEAREAALGGHQRGAEGGGRTVEEREAALEAEAARVERRARLLRAAESRLEELKRSIAAQASAAAPQQSRAGGGEERGKGDTVPRRYFQIMRERGGTGTLRMRTLLPAMLLALSLLMLFIVGRRTTVDANQRLRDPLRH